MPPGLCHCSRGRLWDLLLPEQNRLPHLGAKDNTHSGTGSSWQVKHMVSMVGLAVRSPGCSSRE